MITLWIVVGVACWITVAVPVALAVGRSIRVAEASRDSHPRRIGNCLVHRCGQCDQRVDSTDEELVDV